ncbi:hypothetical protein, variant [Saprolegnia diclina VS20]|uniref:CCZ1/INTU/HSP4 first Longin domain-containing protein n=1 Tax=Saprolegnia diclina (strain VS20) TaxID=1156394 RepID=T0Q7T0_SAPDV|nr:hypothetical protein, variant [Saprolegnia diclina VS20]EQC33924.1 hypothetical protein, variant [Saprolegnia diclina VS20]|eukprot:XP_008612719.1 hypothetical protein, variant [Saprolegnia diclina VS20]
MVLGLFVVDLVGGTLVHARALSRAFQTQYPAKSHMNQAALFFALYNFAGSVVETPSQHDLKYFETTDERYILEPVPAKQWLLVIVTSRATHLAIARHMATVIGAGEAVPMDRKRQVPYFQACIVQALDAAVSSVLETIRERHAAELALVAFDSEALEVGPLTVSVAARSRWRRRWHTWLQRKATTKLAKSGSCDGPAAMRLFPMRCNAPSCASSTDLAY